MRVCSFDASHDLSELPEQDRICPICGYRVMERASPPSPPPDLPVGPPSSDTTPRPPQTSDETVMLRPDPPEAISVDEGSLDPPVALPPVKLLCPRNLKHDLTGLMPGQLNCPQPRCGARLMEVVCGQQPGVHDVSTLDPARPCCPQCGASLLQLVCSADPAHDIAAREPGQLTCPSCGAPLCPIDLPGKSSPPAEPSRRRGGSAIRLPRRWSVLAAAAAVLTIVAAGLVLVPMPGDPCRSIPADPSSALAQLRDTLAHRPAPGQIRIDAGRYLDCRRPELAVPALRAAADAGDGAAALLLGGMYDPSEAPANATRLLPPRAEFALSWYGRALTAGNADATARLDRLHRWLAEAAAKGDGDAAAILKQESP